MPGYAFLCRNAPLLLFDSIKTINLIYCIQYYGEKTKEMQEYCWLRLNGAVQKVGELHGKKSNIIT